MTTLLSTLKQDNRGTVSTEAVIMFPMVALAWMAMFVFFEGLRENNINLKAAYTIGDLLSRETDVIDDEYLDGMNEVFGWLTRTSSGVQMRVTVVRYDEETDKHVMVWSQGVNGRQDLTQELVDLNVTPNVPILADADTAIVVETWTNYTPIMDIGSLNGNTEIYKMVVTPPRFTEQLKHADITYDDNDDHDDLLDDDSAEEL